MVFDMKQIKINVVNKHQHTNTPSDIYIGRGSVLGNPFTHLPLNKSKAQVHVDSREKAITEYKKWIKGKISEFDGNVIGQLEFIKRNAISQHEINLVCFCKPKSCHGDVIKELVEKSITNNIPFDKLTINCEDE